jgi:hypothetical protein
MKANQSASMITGLHLILYSRHSEDVRRFLREAVGLSSVDAGEGWPIFAAPPAELAVHPTDDEPEHAIFLMCDDVAAMVTKLSELGYQTDGGIADRGWGLATTVVLPGGERIGLYEARHPSPLSAR